METLRMRKTLERIQKEVEDRWQQGQDSKKVNDRHLTLRTNLITQGMTKIGLSTAQSWAA